MASEHPDLVEKLDFKICYAPCSITGVMDKVIVTKVNTLDVEVIDDQTGEKKTESLDVFTQESEEGLMMKLRALQAAEVPVPVEVDAETIRANCKYHWVAVYPDGNYVSQYPIIGGETGFDRVDLYQISELWIKPRDPSSPNPSYCLSRDRGFEKLDPTTGDLESLQLPRPDAPFHFQYFRRVAITWGMGAQGEGALPAHVRQCLGWRVDTLHGDPFETVCRIAIEDEGGDWQIEEMAPSESRHLQPKQIHAEVRIIEMVEAPA